MAFLVLVMGATAAVLLLLTEFSNLFSISVDTASCQDLADPDLADGCEVTGGEQHTYALIPIALLVGLMAVGAGPGGSRPAAAALVAAGGVVLLIALALDLPDTGRTGEIGASFTSAEAVKESGFWYELAGGALAAAAGALRLLAERRAARRRAE